MNRLLFLIGVALAIIGLVFSFVPLFNGPSGVLTPSKPDAAFNATTPFSLTGGWTIEVSWTSNHAVSLLVVVCRSINTSAPSLQKVCPGAALSGTERHLGLIELLGAAQRRASHRYCVECDARAPG